MVASPYLLFFVVVVLKDRSTLGLELLGKVRVRVTEELLLVHRQLVANRYALPRVIPRGSTVVIIDRVHARHDAGS